MKYYNSMCNEKKFLENEIAKKEAYVNSAPDGKLYCFKNGDSWRWYVKKEKRKYLSRDEEDVAKALALKGLYENELLDDRQELRAVKMYLSNCSSFERGSKYAERACEFSRLLGEHYESLQKGKTEYVKSWLENKYTGPVPNPEGLVVPTRAGFKVRSKSERDIIRMLMDYNIPFKYEQKMVCDNVDLFPDFTVLSPTTAKQFLWEHNGLMDKFEYVAKKLRDEKLYYKLGYRRGKNMIVTYEENNEGIDERHVEFLIHHMILEDD